jgi:hypothetical protein
MHDWPRRTTAQIARLVIKRQPSLPVDARKIAIAQGNHFFANA